MNHLLLLMPEHFTRQVYPILTEHLSEIKVTPMSVVENQETILEALSHSDFLVWTGIEVTREMLTSSPNLKFIQKWGAGIDGIDLSAAMEMGILVANVPGGNAVAVAEHFFALLLAIYKRICIANESIHSGRWPQAELIDQGIGEIFGKTLGIVGFGRIGRSIAERALAFGIKVIYHKRRQLSVEEERELRVSFAPLSELVRQADIVVLTLPLTRETKGLFNHEILRQMKPSAVLINVARGPIVNESDLYHAIANGNLAGAGLDVFETEPPFRNSPLLRLSSVVTTPHIAGRSKEAIRQITLACAENIRLVLKGEEANNLVNLKI